MDHSRLVEVSEYVNRNAPHLAFEKSSFSDLDYKKDCVGFAVDGDRIAVTHTKDADAPVLRYTRSEIAAMVRAAKAGQLDKFC